MANCDRLAHDVAVYFVHCLRTADPSTQAGVYFDIDVIESTLAAVLAVEDHNLQCRGIVR